MAAKWPDVEVLKGRSMKGGGDRGAKRTYLSVTARSTAPCGQDFEVKERNIHPSVEEQKARQVPEQLKEKVRSHIRGCAKCQAKGSK